MHSNFREVVYFLSFCPNKEVSHKDKARKRDKLKLKARPTSVLVLTTDDTKSQFDANYCSPCLFGWNSLLSPQSPSSGA